MVRVTVRVRCLRARTVDDPTWIVEEMHTTYGSSAPRLQPGSRFTLRPRCFGAGFRNTHPPSPGWGAVSFMKHKKRLLPPQFDSLLVSMRDPRVGPSTFLCDTGVPHFLLSDLVSDLAWMIRIVEYGSLV